MMLTTSTPIATSSGHARASSRCAHAGSGGPWKIRCTAQRMYPADRKTPKMAAIVAAGWTYIEHTNVMSSATKPDLAGSARDASPAMMNKIDQKRDGEGKRGEVVGDQG